MRRHNPNDATSACLQPSCDNPKDNILASKNTNDPTTFYNTDGGGASFLHYFGNFPHAGLGPNGSRLRARVHHRSQIWKSCFLSKLFGPCKHGCSLRVVSYWTEFSLNSGHCTEELLWCSRTTFNFVQSFVEHLSDIKQSYNIALFIADGLERGLAGRHFCHKRWSDQMSKVFRHHQLQCLCRACAVASNHRITRHNLANWSRMWVNTLRSDLWSWVFSLKLGKQQQKRRTRYARSFAVKIPLNPSSSSTTRTQSVRFAAHNWLASATDIFSGTVRAGEGLSAATVPFAASFPPRCFLLDWCVVEMVRFRDNSDSIFFRIA